MRHDADSMAVYLVPSGAGRFELYTEAADDRPRVEPTGRVARAIAAGVAGWRQVVETARARRRTGFVGRTIDAAVCRLADRLALQHGFGALRGRAEVVAHFPSTLDAARADVELRRGLERLARHHRWRCAIYLSLFVVSGLLAIVPGPNILAYYFAVALFGHLQAWRGASHAALGVRWLMRDDPHLAALVRLVDLPRDARQDELAAIAEQMHLRRLPAFFDRVAVPSR